MIDGTPRRRVPATALCIATERHEANISALRESKEPAVAGPSLYKMALAVVRRGPLDVYRRARVT